MVTAVVVPEFVVFDVEEELVLEFPVVVPFVVLFVVPIVEDVAVFELPFATWNISTELRDELVGTVTCPCVSIAVIEARPPTIFPPPSSAMRPNTIAAFFPRNEATFI